MTTLLEWCIFEFIKFVHTLFFNIVEIEKTVKKDEVLENNDFIEEKSDCPEDSPIVRVRILVLSGTFVLQVVNEFEKIHNVLQGENENRSYEHPSEPLLCSWAISLIPYFLSFPSKDAEND